jgi:hypothetical protein
MNFSRFSKAQSYLSFDVGRMFSTFNYSEKTNRSDNPLKNQHYSEVPSTTFGIDYKYINHKGLLLSGGLGLRKAGALMTDKQISCTWDLQYIDIKGGMGYQYNKSFLKPYVTILPYFAYLLNAKQTIGNDYYDIKTTRSIKNYDWGTFINLGCKFDVYHNISVFAEYNYNLGLNNIETEERQYLYNRGFSLNAGLMLLLRKPSFRQ